MRIITVGSELPRDTEHLVLTVTSEPVIYFFRRAVDDILITSPDGDVLLCWDLSHESNWDNDNCLLLQARDNMKEIGNIKTSLIAIKAREENKKLTVYLTAQIN